MERFPVGIIILIIVSILIYLGLAQRALDRMRLSDRGALVVIAAIILGSLSTFPFYLYNLGKRGVRCSGSAVYLLKRAGITENGPGPRGAVFTGRCGFTWWALINTDHHRTGRALRLLMPFTSPWIVATRSGVKESGIYSGNPGRAAGGCFSLFLAA